MAPRRTRPIAWFSRIVVRLLAFNLLLVFLPVAGILYLDVYENRLLEGEERAMVQQGRLVAAALSEHETIDPARAGDLLSRLGQRGDARLRIYSTGTAVLADSNKIRFPGEPAMASADGPSTYPVPSKGVRTRVLYQLGAEIAAMRRRLVSVSARIVVPRRRAPGAGTLEREPPPEVLAALAGRYGAATRPTPGQRSLTLYSAVPVRRGNAIIGAVLVSQTTFRVLRAVYDVRLRIFEVVVASILAAAMLSTVAAATVVRPLVRLTREASDLAERRSRLPGKFDDASRHDELGDLARSLAELTRRLDEHIRTVEQFASDVSHEFRNPLAAIRSAAEMAGRADTDEQRVRFLDMLTRDVDRLERLVSSVRELARIDTELEQEPLGRVDVGRLLDQLVEGLRLAEPDLPAVVVTVQGGPAVVRASEDRLAQVFENVLANARTFAPAGTRVEVSVTIEASGEACVVIADRGPGIPPAHLERVFDRFFSYRPGDPPGSRSHTGLGLSIARTIVRGFGGTLTAANRPGGGSLLEIRIPTTNVYG
jgi:two-component system sensor histidine kinase ChvG